MRFLLLSVLLIFICTSEAAAQVMVPFKVITKNKLTDKKEAGITVKLIQGGTTIQTLTSDGSGVVNLQIPAGKKYKIEVSKAGKVTRYATVDLINVVDELLQGNSAPKAELTMSLFDQTPGIDYSYVTSNAATEFYFDPAVSHDLIPDEVLADKMIKRVDKLLKDAEALGGQSDANYNAAIKEADAFYTAKKYQEALASYEKALTIKPKEAHPNQRLAEIDGILKAQKANDQQGAQIESEYQALITAADNLFGQKKYEEAITRYNEALTKKQEQYPKDQVTKANAEINRLKTEAENAGKYTAAIQAGDGFMGQKSFQAAKDKYKEALKWKKDDPYATGKLAEIDGKLNAQKADQDKKKKYDDANTAADALFAEEKWVEAKAKYNEALVIEPSSTYSKGRIDEINVKIAEQEKEKAKADQIVKLLAEGNTAFGASQWPVSKTKYQEVLKLDAANTVATGRLAEIEAKINEEKADADKIAKIKELVTAGDALAKQSKPAEAKAKYVEAIGLKPDGAIQVKIDAMDAQLTSAAQKAEQKANYDKAMTEGEAAFAAGNYEAAKTKFKDALAIDAAQAVPKQRIIDADKKLADALANADKAEKFTAAMNAGSTALSAKDLAEAKKKFQEAIAIDATKPEAKTKLAEVEALLASDAKAKENEQKYQAAIKAGGDLMTANKLAEAKVKFQEAGTLDPSQALPKQKITEIDGLIAQADKQKQIDLLVKDGTTAFDKKDLPNARAKFQQVLTIDAGNTIAAAKIQEIAKLENDMAGEAQKEARFKQLKDEAVALMAQTKYQEAKQKLEETKAIKSDAGVDQLIKECDTKIEALAKGAESDKLYASAVAEAQVLESSKKYDEAIAKYNEALKIKNEQLPKDRIAAINQLKSANASQAKIDADYLDLMKKGDDAFAAKKYVDAIQFYNQALLVKPNEKDPVTKAAAAQAEEAKNTKSTEDDAYNKIVSVADKAMEEKNYTKAKEIYNRALGFRANDPYPKQKLAEIDALLKADQANQDKNAAYTKKIGEAEAAATANKLENAIALFEQAKTIKPDETLPDNRIAQLRAQLEGSTNAAAAAEQRYQSLMTEGNNAATAKEYQTALGKYQEALKVKKDDKPAQDKIAEMRQLLDDLAKANSKNSEVQGLLAKADGKFDGKQWMDAKAIYEKVILIDPSNSYAKERSLLCDQKAKDEVQEGEEIQYRKVIAKADDNFDIKDYDKAREYYKRALNFRASDPYPKRRLAEIDAILNPTPVVAVVPKSTGPEPLPSLGDPADNSLSNQALLDAETERKKRKTLRFNRKVHDAGNQDTMIAQQAYRTEQTNSGLGVVAVAGDKATAQSEDGRKENVQVLSGNEKTVSAKNEQDATYEVADNLNARTELVNANQASEDGANALKGAGDENEKIIKKQDLAISNESNETSKEVYGTIIDNKTRYNATEIKIQQIDLDDTKSREITEGGVRDAKQAVIVVDETNQQRTAENLEVIKTKVNDFEKGKTLKEVEEAKLAPANQDEVVKIEKSISAGNKTDYDEHINNSLIVRSDIETIEAEVIKSTIKSDDARQENVEVLLDRAKTQEEKDRADFNSMMVKSIANGEVIKKDVREQDQFNGQSSAATTDNSEKIKAINTGLVEDTRIAQQTEVDKRDLNQQTITGTKLVVEGQSTTGSEKSADNEAILKQKRQDQSTSDQNDSKAAQDKTQNSRQSIAAIEKKEIVPAEKEANDIGKLYPEGVSQEQFEKKDADGLLQEVITRRVVVKNGHGTVYIRNQSLNSITYSRDGQPSTEYIWQKETQDGSLVRNY